MIGNLIMDLTSLLGFSVELVRIKLLSARRFRKTEKPRDGDPWGRLRSCPLHPLALRGMQDLPVISVTLELMAIAVPES